MAARQTASGQRLFRPSRHGYDRSDVDAYLAEQQARLETLRRQVATPDAAVRSALERAGAEVARILQQAHETAEQIVAQAQREAAQHRDAAARHVAELSAAAQRRVHELDIDADRIWAERKRLIADARDLAKRLSAVAELATGRFPEDSAAPAATGVAAAALATTGETGGTGLVVERAAGPSDHGLPSRGYDPRTAEDGFELDGTHA